jgi:hypothetical protein
MAPPDVLAPEVNPYAAPQDQARREWPILPESEWSSLDLRLANVTRRGLVRILRLAGTLDSEILYDGFTPPSERILVNGVVRARGPIWYPALVAPTVEFTIEADGYRLPARIDAKAGLSPWTLLGLARFRLTIAGRVLYSEGRFADELAGTASGPR